MPSRASRVVANGKSSFFFMAASIPVYVCVCTVACVSRVYMICHVNSAPCHPFTRPRCVGGFHVVAVVNDAVGDAGGACLFQLAFSFPCGQRPDVGSLVAPALILRGNSTSFPTAAAPTYTPPAEREAPGPPRPRQHLSLASSTAAIRTGAGRGSPWFRSHVSDECDVGHASCT